MRQALVVTVFGVVLVGAGIIGRCPSAGGEQTSKEAAPASSLDGTTWPVKLIPDAAAAQKGEKSFDDELAFKNGQVAMSACIKAGFAPSSYTLAPSGSAWSFETRQISKKQEKTDWRGLVSGDSIKGTMVWTKADGTIIHYNYEGKKTTTSTASSTS